MEDLKSRKWSESRARIEFKPDLMHSKHYDPSFLATFSTGGSSRSRRAAFKCIRCGEMVPLDACSNCNSLGYIPGLDPTGIAGIFCFECERGFTSWTCQNCSTKNPVKNSMVTEIKKGCFIATAVYESETAEEVLVLRNIRDQYLLRSKIGAYIVHSYYRYSPRLARKIEGNPILRNLIRNLLVEPTVKFAKFILRK